MYFDNRPFGMVDVAIAETLAEQLDDGQPKPSLKAALRRLLGRGNEAVQQADEPQSRPAHQEPLKNWR